MAQTLSPGSAVQRTAFPITAIGINWTGPRNGLRVRLYDKDGKAGEWQDVTAGCPCGKDPQGASKASAQTPSRALVPGGGSFGYQVDAAPGMHVVSAVAIDSGKLPAPVPKGNGTGASAAASRSSAPVFPPDGLITRKMWEADEKKRFKADGSENSPTKFFPAQALTVHHTATANDDPDPAATVRAIYEQHAIANDWGDIGYHFLIDREGRIYEGRFSGDDGVPAHDERGDVVTAFHTVGFNSGNIGVALLGDFDKGEPTPRMREALARLLASLAKKHGLDPESDIAYRNPVDGKTKQAPAVSGHQDWIFTECPGARTYMDLPAVRKQTARLLVR